MEGREIMKRLFAFLLTTTMLLGLAGCKSSTPQSVAPDFEQLPMTPGQTHSDYSGIEVRIDSLNWQQEDGKTTLTVTWNNNTDLDAVYGAAYTIERLDGEEWVSCAIQDDLAFIAIAYELKAGRTVKESYNLTATYDVSSPGTYRFKTDCYVHENATTSTKCELIAEFTIGRIKCREESKVTGTEVAWCAQYVRTNGGYEAQVLYPCVRIIHSLQELNDYYNTWHEVFDLERKDQVYADTTIGFLDVCDQYDEAFFEENYLIFVLLEEGSGSVRHEVRSVEQTEDQKISISIDRNVPEVGTDDMAQWHIILELSRDVLVENSIDTYLYVDGLPSYMDDQVVPPQIEGEYKEPPKGTLITPHGETPLSIGGYHWIYSVGNGLENATIADQAGRPLPEETLTPVIISSEYAETIYTPVPGTNTYKPTNSLGYLVKLAWEDEPSSVSYTCWPEKVWRKNNVKEEAVVSQDSAFYAKQGGYVYEIVATWEDNGIGYHGSANYYVYIMDVVPE